MTRNLVAVVISLFVCGAILATRAQSRTARGQASITIFSYNVQNLFDDVENGTEYPRFRAAAGWTTNRYHNRLIRLSDTIAMAGTVPDVIVLQEVEGASVVDDLLTDYVRQPFTVIISADTSGANRVVVLSRFPVQSARAHVSTSVSPGGPTSEPRENWRSRVMLDTVIAVGGPDPVPVRLIASHWKSQSGGERETEVQRIQAAALISRLLQTDDGGAAATVIVGDLNEDVDEYRQHGGEYTTALMPANVSAGAPAQQRARTLAVVGDLSEAVVAPGHVVAYSPWLDPEIEPGCPGSYIHDSRWERLDHILIVPGQLSPDQARWEPVGSTFRVVSDPPLRNSRGEPARYDPGTGWGYSDHFPILATVSLQSVQIPR